jgi:hypothetical protein
MMSLRDGFLEKWQQCKDKRYPVMLIVPSHNGVFSDSFFHEVRKLIGAEQLDFIDTYKGLLDTFFTWNKIQKEILEEATKYPLVITNLEPFYSKWPVHERLAFLRYMLRSETSNNIALVLHCREDLSALRSINEKNRGFIWIP